MGEKKHSSLFCKGTQDIQVCYINPITVSLYEENSRKTQVARAQFMEHGLTPIPAQKIKSALIKECYGHMECKVWNHYECGDHTLIVGEVIAGSVNQDVLDENNNLVITKAKPVIQKNWNYHTVKKAKKIEDYFKSK
jgi:flavin reductase (DIM6/NTAB) family NADH-FMN oxidoreductase RutF